MLVSLMIKIKIAMNSHKMVNITLLNIWFLILFGLYPFMKLLDLNLWASNFLLISNSIKQIARHSN